MCLFKTSVKASLKAYFRVYVKVSFETSCEASFNSAMALALSSAICSWWRGSRFGTLCRSLVRVAVGTIERSVMKRARAVSRGYARGLRVLGSWMYSCSWSLIMASLPTHSVRRLTDAHVGIHNHILCRFWPALYNSLSGSSARQLAATG